LLNTCSVREKAQEKVFSLLGRWREIKAERPQTIIGVGGCVASQEGEAILKRAPFVDVVFGPQTLHRLPEMIAQVRRGRPGVVDVSFPGDREVRPHPGAAKRPLHGVPVGHGRLQQVLHVLRRAVYARRGDQPAARRRDRRSRIGSPSSASRRSTCSVRTSMRIAARRTTAARRISRR
jgi:hypothetical protein